MSTHLEIKPDDKRGTVAPVCPVCDKKMVEGKIWLHAEANTSKVRGYLYWAAGKDLPSEHWKVEGKSTLLKTDGFLNAYPSRQAYQCSLGRSLPAAQ